MRRGLLVLCMLAACGGGDPAGDDAPDAGTDAAVDPTDQLFDPGHVLEVTITLDAADWEQLRNEPEQIGLPDDTCAADTDVEAYTWFHADIDVDGTTVTDVAVRKKGNLGSLSTTRPGLKVDIHEYVTSQRLFGMKHLTLNNNNQDDTLISQCLGYGLFAAADIPAPRCSFAHVTVNGEDLGIYTNVESIKPDFLERHFADENGHLYESGGDFTPGGVGGFQPKSDPVDCTDLDAVVDALAAPADQRAERVGAVVDLDEFSRYWAMEVITSHWDGYANNRNNYYFYDDPTSGRLQFIPWGIDALFTERQRTTRPQSVFACGSMAWRLYDLPETRARYLAAVRDLLGTVWDENAILDEISRMESLLAPWTEPATGEAIDRTRAFVMTRADTLLAELDAGDPVWPFAENESCLIHIGTITATFDTTWGSIGTFPPDSGTMTGTVAGVDVGTPTVHAVAGLGDDGKPTMQILGALPDGRYAVIFAIVQDPANWTTGAKAIDLANVAALMTFYDPATDTATGGGLLLPGTFDLSAASMTDGGAVTGSITGEVLEL